MYRQAIKAKQQFSIKSNQNREIRIKKGVSQEREYILNFCKEFMCLSLRQKLAREIEFQ